MAHPEKLGFPRALSIRNCRIANGLVDIVLFPEDGPVDLVLVEAKASVAPDAACKVIGQLLMYYAGALKLGSEGLRMMRSFAVNHKDEARSTKKIPHIRLAGIKPSEKAWDALTKGARLKPEKMRMFIALNNKPHHALAPTLAALRQHHRLPIGLVVVKDGKITVVQQCK